MSVDASSLAPAFMDLQTAIEDCCEDIIENELAMNAELGLGLEIGLNHLAQAYAQCCTEQLDAIEVVIPPSTTTLPDGTVINNPGFTGPYWAYQAQQQASAWNTQTAAYSGAYDDYITQLNEWQDEQTVPMILALLANLAAVLAQIELYNQMLGCVNQLLDCVKEEVAALKDLSIGTLIPAVAAHTDQLMAKFASGAALTAICDQRDGISARATSLWDCFENTFKPELTQYLAQFDADMFANSTIGTEELVNLQTLSAELRACFDAVLKPETEATAPVIGEAIRTMADKMDVACDWLVECAEKLGGHWDTAYAQKDADYACAAMESATMSLEGAQEVKDFLLACRETLKTIHANVYAPGEATHVPLLHEAASETIGVMTDVANCAFECAEDEKTVYAVVYEAAEAEHAAELHAAATDTAGALTDVVNCAYDCALAEKMIFDTTYLPGEAMHVPALHMVATNTVENLEKVSDCAFECAEAEKLIYDTAYLDTELVYAPMLHDVASETVGSLTDVTDCAYECALGEKAIYDTVYAAGEAEHAPALDAVAVDTVENLTEVSDCALECSFDEKAIFDTTYLPGEAIHVPALDMVATDTVANLTTVSDCALECAFAEKAIYDDTYKAKENALSIAAMEEACALNPCFSEIKDWLVEHSNAAEACWEEWKPKETEYLCTIIEKAIDRLCDLDDELDDFCQDVMCFKDHWTNCFEQAECATAPKLITAAIAACDKQQSTYNLICDHQEHLWSKFENTWCPWDEQDAQYFCDFWIKTNPLNELCQNHECQQEMGELLKDCYKDLVLPWEKAYIEEICAMEKYDPKYCETEDAAQLAIISGATKAAERAIKINPRYCSGATKQQLIDIQNQALRARAAAVASANRDERWWEVQECDRRHRYTMDVLERLGKRFPDHALEFTSASSNILDGILGRMHERLLRGYEYVRNTNDYARTVLNANQAAIDASQRVMQAGHDYADAFIRGKSAWFTHSNEFIQNSQISMQQGQFYGELASQDRERANTVINNASNWGFQHLQHGHQHVRTALEAKKVSADTANAAQQAALQSHQIGHQHVRTALDAKRTSSDAANAAQQAALQSHQIGHQHVRTALEAKKVSADTANSAQQAALQSFQIGHQHVRTALDAKRVSSDAANAAQQAALQSHQIGHQHVRTALDAKKVTADTASSAQQAALQSFQNGHQHVRTAIDAKKVAADTANAVQNAAIQSYSIGQDYLRIALQAMQEELRQQQQSLTAATGAQQVGAEYAQLAANKMETVMKSALQAVQLGNQMMDNNRMFGGMVLGGYDTAVRTGVASYGNFINAQQIGVNFARTSGQMDQVSLASAMDTLSSTCDFLSRNHCCTAANASQANSGALSTATGLLSGAANGIAEGVNGAIGALTALNQPPNPPVAPSGNVGFNYSGGQVIGNP